MLRHVCRWCQLREQVDGGPGIRSASQAKEEPRRARGIAAAMAVVPCEVCELPSIMYGELDLTSNHEIPNVIYRVDNALLLRSRKATRQYPGVPGHIASAAIESHRCGSARHLRAAVLLARAVVEATAKANGAVRGTLEAKIDEMYDRGMIQQGVRSAADEVRYFGNQMAHGDFVDPIDASDAEFVLALMDEILLEVFC